MERELPTKIIVKTKHLQAILAAVVFAVITGSLLGFFVAILAYNIVIGTLPPGTNSSGLIGWWSLDENQGNTVKNFVGGKSGQIWYISQTSPWPAGAGPWQATGALNTGSAVKFDGGRSYILLDDSFSDVANNQLTVSYWIYLKKLPSNMTSGGNPIVMNKYTVKADSYTPDVVYYTQYFDRTSNKLAIKWIDSAGVAHDKSPISNQTFATNTLYNITWVFGNGESKLYINGVLDTSTPSFTTQIRAGAGRLHLSSPYQSLDGAVIDDVRIYNRALSNSEVGNIWRKSIPLSLKDLAFIGLKCKADSDGNIAYDDCYQAVDNVCSIQSIKSKDICIESVIESLYLSDEEYAPDIAGDLVIKYCLNPLTYEKTQRPICYGDFFGVSGDKFETETNARLIMDQLNQIVQLSAKAAAATGTCNYQAINNCQNLAQIIVNAVSGCPGGGTCPRGAISSATNASTTVICRFAGGWKEVMSIDECKNKPHWYSYCQVSPRCPSYIGDNVTPCDCGWLDPTITTDRMRRDRSQPLCTPIVNTADSWIYNGYTFGGTPEFWCKISKIVGYIPSCASVPGLHRGGSATDIFFSGCTNATSSLQKAIDIIGAGRSFMAFAGEEITATIQTNSHMSEVSELTPCEMSANGSTGPHVHVDLRRRRRPFPCAFFDTDVRSNWNVCHSGEREDYLYFMPSGEIIQEQLNNPTCSRWY